MVGSMLSLLGSPFLVNKRTPTTDIRVFNPDNLRIRCPLCQWQPGKQDRWYCEPGCANHWNTFETAGICPRCTKHWEETACLRCGGWSRHEDWYERENS